MNSQNSKIDSLKIELVNHKSKDTVRVNILNHLAFYNYRNNPPKAEEYIEKARELAHEINDAKGIAKNYYVKGVIALEKGSFSIAIENFKKAIEKYTILDDLDNLAKCNNALGVLSYYQGNSEVALKYYKESLRIKKEAQ